MNEKMTLAINIQMMLDRSGLPQIEFEELEQKSIEDLRKMQYELIPICREAMSVNTAKVKVRIKKPLRLGDLLGSIWMAPKDDTPYMLIAATGGFVLVDLSLGSLLREPSQDYKEVTRGFSMLFREARITVEARR